MSKLYSVVAIIRDPKGRFLAVSRKDDHNDLGFAGGKIDPGESPEQALIRELREETGLVVTRRALRVALVAADEKGRLCKGFEISSYKGVPEPKEGAWVGWVEPARLIESCCTFKDYNVLVFKQLGVSVEPLEIAPPEPKGLTLEAALLELTSFEVYPQRHITFLYGPTALLFCPKESMHQPRMTFDANQFSGLLKSRVLAIRTHLQPSLIPLNLFRYMHSLQERCLAGVVAISPHRPPDDWERVASITIECLPHDAGAQMTLMKNLLSSACPVGTSVVVSRPPVPETTTLLPAYQA